MKTLLISLLCSIALASAYADAKSEAQALLRRQASLKAEFDAWNARCYGVDGNSALGIQCKAERTRLLAKENQLEADQKAFLARHPGSPH